MKWPNLKQSGFALSVQSVSTGKKQFFLKVLDTKTSKPYLKRIKNAGFTPVPQTEGLYSSPLTFQSRNILLSLNGATLFQTTPDNRHENPYDGFRPLRSPSVQTFAKPSPNKSEDKTESGNTENILEESRPRSATTDRRILPTDSSSESDSKRSNLSNLGSKEQLGDEYSNSQSGSGNDFLGTGTSPKRLDSNEHIRPGNNVESSVGQSRSDGREGDIRSIKTDQLKPKQEKTKSNLNHFYITDEIIREAGFQKKTRALENIEAITLLKQLQKEDRAATLEEKSKLVKYNGWGGINPTEYYYQKPQDSDEYFKDIISSEERESISASVLSAHFTPPHIIKALWESLERDLNFKGGKILEPSMGVGNFLGLASKDIIQNSSITGIELDSITGQIAQKIYPDTQIHIQGFEDTPLINDQFDLTISNVPFGDYKIHDKTYKKDRSVHNYFLIKSLDKLKPGGIGVFITSSFTMDGLDRDAKTEMHKRAHLLGALRLPNTAMQAQAGTTVSTDILLFQKRVSPKPFSEIDPSWLDVYETEYSKKYTKPDIFRTNSYFIDNPESLLGNMDITPSRFGLSRVVVDDPNRPLEELLPKALHELIKSEPVQKHLKDNSKMLLKIKTKKPVPPKKRINLADQKKSIDSYVKKDGKIYQISGDDGSGIAVKGPARKLQRLSGFIDLRETLNCLYDIQRKTVGDDPEFIKQRDKLNQQYDHFVTKHGNINSVINRRLFLSDPEAGKVLALETYNEETKEIKKADVFNCRILGRPEQITKVETAHEALTVCMDQYNQVNLDTVAKLCGKSESDIRKELKNDIFLNPQTDKWEIAALYLSGNVREKLEIAEDAEKENKYYSHNVAALKKIIPKEIPAAEIETRLGVPWVSVKLHEDFVKDLLNDSFRTAVSLDKRSVDSKWTVDLNTNQIDRDKLTIEFGTDRQPFGKILKACLAQKIVKVYDTYTDNGITKRVYNHKDTVAAQHKQEEIQRHFRTFLWSKDQDRATELAAKYNRKHNAYVAPTFDGSHQTFPGMSKTYKPREYQANGVYRCLFGNTLLRHDVGTGKTFQQVTAAMEMKRLGVARKPAMIIPNQTLEQINREAHQIYPAANILFVQGSDFKKANRKKFIGKVANNDWDLVIMGHTMFERIMVDPDFEKSYLQEIKSLYKTELERIKEVTDGKTITETARYGQKDIQKRIKTLEAKIKRISESNKDDQIFLHDLGIDALFIDEAHRYKNLMIVSASAEVSGNIKGSKRAWDLFMKTQWFAEELRQDNKGIVFATGTPVTNNPLEIYNLQRYLQMDVLEDQGVANATDWYSTFIYPKVSWEPSHAARGWNIRVRPCLHNVPELISTFRNTMDVVTAEDAGIKRPEVTTKVVVSPQSELQMEMMDELDQMVQKQEEHIFTIMHRGRTMALDPRLSLEFDEKLPEDWTDPVQIEEEFPFAPGDYLDAPNSKLSLAANNIAKIWKESSEIRGTQLVFSDLGVPGTRKRFNIYDALRDKLIEKGIPREEIQFIHDFPKDDQKARLFEDVRQGTVRALFGSTSKMGEGLNVQDRAVALHNLDCPYTPAGIEQRNGRVHRFGNLNENVTIFNYTTKDTFDLFLWNLLKLKNEQFRLILTGASTFRKFDFEIDPSYAETAALTSGNPLILEKLEVEENIGRLEALESSHYNTVNRAKLYLEWAKPEYNDLKKILKKIQELPQPTETPSLWRLKVTRFKGFDKDFETDSRERLTKAVRALKSKTHLTQFKDDTISFGGIPVSNYQEQDQLNEKQTYTTWEIGGIKRSTASRIEELVKNRDRIIVGCEDKIKKQLKKIDRLETVINDVFKDNDSLIDLKVKLNDINRRIEVDANQKNESEQDEEAQAKGLQEDPVGQECINAIKNKDLHAFKNSLEELEINKILPNRKTILTTALGHKEENFALDALAAGADPDKTGDNNYPPLHTVCQYDLSRVAARMVKENVTLNQRNSQEEVEMHVAAFNNSLKTAKLLLKTSKIDLGAQNQNNESPIFDAIIFHHTEMALLLIDHSTIEDLEIKNLKGNTISHITVKQENKEVFQMLYDKHPDLIDITNNEGITPRDIIQDRELVDLQNILDNPIGMAI